MKSYLKDLLELFSCNWNTIFVGWRGLGFLSPWPDEWERFPPLLSTDELDGYCHDTISDETSQDKCMLIVALMEEIADSHHTRTSILECVKSLAEQEDGEQKCEESDQEFRKWRCAMVYSVLHDPALDEFEMVRRLDELWVELGSPNDIPLEIKGRFLSRCMNPGYGKEVCARQLKCCREWLSKEITMIKCKSRKGRMDADLIHADAR